MVLDCFYGPFNQNNRSSPKLSATSLLYFATGVISFVFYGNEWSSVNLGQQDNRTAPSKDTRWLTSSPHGQTTTSQSCGIKLIATIDGNRNLKQLASEPASTGQNL
ncbi:hypothetical protein DERF_010978 [Dermatophagoides farinae]|uniref:Uncharacterized protein n=1 Tax=Dermatophagoides farinae TaxID=6954 RepID=A0A922HS39_DERFA|nr:hypothetical protein DERF_010978 [Dermatophagoides farinae]